MNFDIVYRKKAKGEGKRKGERKGKGGRGRKGKDIRFEIIHIM